MTQSTRRRFLGQIGSAAVVIPGLRNLPFGAGSAPSSASASPQAAQGSPQASASASFDLLIAGGRVIDPSQKLNAERDVAIVGGEDRARRGEHSTKPGSPGVRRQGQDRHARADRHAHPRVQVRDHSQRRFRYRRIPSRASRPSSTAGRPAPRRSWASASTSWRPRPTRIYALLNISTIGLIVTNEIYLDPRMIDARAAIRTITAESRSHHGHQGPGERQTQRPGARPGGHEDGARGRGCHGPADHDALVGRAGAAGDVETRRHPRASVQPAVAEFVEPVRRRDWPAGRQGPAADPRAQGPRYLDRRPARHDASLVGSLRESREAGLVSGCDFDRHQQGAGREPRQCPGTHVGVPAPGHAARAGDRGRHVRLRRKS